MNKKNDDIDIINNIDKFDDFNNDMCGCNLCYTTRIVQEFFMNLIPNNRYFRNPFMFFVYIVLFLVICEFILGYTLFVLFSLCKLLFGPNLT